MELVVIYYANLMHSEHQRWQIQSFALVDFELCCFMTPGLSEDMCLF